MDFDSEDKVIVVRVIDIDDIISFHGTSVAELEAAFNTAVDSYTYACEQLGQTADKPASGQMKLRVNPVVNAAGVKVSC